MDAGGTVPHQDGRMGGGGEEVSNCGGRMLTKPKYFLASVVGMRRRLCVPKTWSAPPPQTLHGRGGGIADTTSLVHSILPGLHIIIQTRDDVLSKLANEPDIW